MIPPPGLNLSQKITRHLKGGAGQSCSQVRSGQKIGVSNRGNNVSVALRCGVLQRYIRCSSAEVMSSANNSKAPPPATSIFATKGSRGTAIVTGGAANIGWAAPPHTSRFSATPPSLSRGAVGSGVRLGALHISLGLCPPLLLRPPPSPRSP